MAESAHKIEVRRETRDGGVVAHLVFDNARRLNVLNPPALHDLTATFHALSAEEDVRVVVFSGAGGIFANVLHAGGMVGSAGPSRMVPAMAFAAAPRMHSGGMAGLRHDEVPAILQRGERVLSRREAQSYGAGGGINVTIMARDAESFRQSRTQIAADIARAVSLGRRGM